MILPAIMKNSVAGIMQCLRVLGRGRHVRLHHLDDEEVIAIDQGVLKEPALEIGVALADQRRLNLACDFGGKTEFLELVVGRLMTHSLLFRKRCDGTMPENSTKSALRRKMRQVRSCSLALRQYTSEATDIYIGIDLYLLARR